MSPGRDGSMLEFGGQFEAEVMDLYKIEDSNKEAFKVRGAPLKWRRVCRARCTEQESGEKIVG